MQKQYPNNNWVDLYGILIPSPFYCQPFTSQMHKQWSLHRIQGLLYVMHQLWEVITIFSGTHTHIYTQKGNYRLYPWIFSLPPFRAYMIKNIDSIVSNFRLKQRDENQWISWSSSNTYFWSQFMNIIISPLSKRASVCWFYGQRRYGILMN